MLNGIQNQFLAFYGLVVLSVVLSLMFLRRKPSQPSRLRLREEKKAAHLRSTPLRERPTVSGGAEVYDEDFDPSVKHLGVMFNYNGHSWEAFESLGLPAGSSLEEVQRTYKTLCSKRLETKDENFFKAAYQAILQAR